MAKKQKTSVPVVSTPSVELSIPDAVRDLIPNGVVAQAPIQNKISKADIVNIVSSGIVDAIQTKIDEIQKERILKSNNITKNKETVKSKVIKAVANTLNEKIESLRIVSNHAGFSIHLLSKVQCIKIDNDLTIELHQDEVFHQVECKYEQNIKIEEELALLNDQLNRLSIAMRRASDKKYVQAQIDRAFLAKSSKGDEINTNINILTNEILDKFANDLNRS